VTEWASDIKYVVYLFLLHSMSIKKGLRFKEIIRSKFQLNHKAALIILSCQCQHALSCEMKWKIVFKKMFRSFNNNVCLNAHLAYLNVTRWYLISSLLYTKQPLFEGSTIIMAKQRMVDHLAFKSDYTA
jgi:hypothetical protein